MARTVNEIVNRIITTYESMQASKTLEEFDKLNASLAQTNQQAAQAGISLTQLQQATEKASGLPTSQMNKNVEYHRELVASQNLLINKYEQLTPATQKAIVAAIKLGSSYDQLQKIVKGTGQSIGSLNQFLDQIGVGFRNHDAAAAKTGDTYSKVVQSMRGFRYAILAMMAEMNVLVLAQGEQMSDQVRQFEKIAMMMSSAGVMAAMVGAPVGPAVLTTALLGVVSAQFSLSESTQEVNKHLQDLSKQDRVIDTLSEVLGVSKELAKEMDELAKKSPEYASALKQVFDASRELSAGERYLYPFINVLQQIGDKFADTSPKVKKSAAEIREAMDDLLRKQATGQGQILGLDLFQLMNLAIDQDRALDAERKSSAAEAIRSAEVQKQANEKILDSYKEVNKAIGDYNDSVKRNGKQLESSYEQIAYSTEQSMARARNALQNVTGSADFIGTASRALNDALRAAEKQRSEAMANLAYSDQRNQAKNAEAWRKIEDSYRDASYRAWQQYNNKLQDSGRARGEKLTDLERDYHKKLSEMSDDRAKRAQDLAYKLYTIERDRIEAIADLDFNTALDLSKAKTANEKDEIEWRALHERSQINQRARDDREDALNKFSQDEADAAKRRRDLEIETHYRRTVIQREYENQLADARRTYEQALEAARDSFNDQVAAQRFAEKEQAAERAHQLEQIRQNNESAKQSAQERYNQEIADAKRRYKAEVDEIFERDRRERELAQKRYNEENEQARAALIKRKEEIAQSLQEFWDAHKIIMQGLQSEFDLAIAIASLRTQTLAMSPSGISGVDIGQLTSKTGGAGGLEMIVPPGYNNDSFPIYASSGEQVSITPAQNVSSQPVNISVEPMMQPLVQGLLDKMINSNLFKEGVKIVVNDAVYQG